MSKIQRCGDAWATPSLVDEAVKNVLLSPSRIRWVLFAAVLLGVALTILRAVELNVLENQLEVLAGKGRNLLIIQGLTDDQKPRIDRSSCEDLTMNSGVVVAGGIVSRQDLSVAQLGTTPLQAGSTTLFPELRSTSVVVGADLIDRRPGDQFNLLLEGESTPAIVGDRRPDGISTNSAIVTGFQASENVVDKCIVVLDQQQDASQAASTSLAQLDVKDHHVVATLVLQDVVDPVEQYLNRPSRFVPMGIGALLGGIIALTTFLRSSELATYRMSGTSRASLTLLLFFEACCCVGVYWAASGIATLFIVDRGLIQASVVADHLSVASLTIALATTAAIATLRRSPIALAKDR
jgi:hypothetical protein